MHCFPLKPLDWPLWTPILCVFTGLCPPTHYLALTTLVQLQTKDLDPKTLSRMLSSLSSCVSIQMGMVTHYNVEYTIQETTCPRGTEEVTAEKCPLMECEFTVSRDKLFFLHWSNVSFSLQDLFCMLKRDIIILQVNWCIKFIHYIYCFSRLLLKSKCVWLVLSQNLLREILIKHQFMYPDFPVWRFF